MSRPESRVPHPRHGLIVAGWGIVCGSKRPLVLAPPVPRNRASSIQMKHVLSTEATDSLTVCRAVEKPVLSEAEGNPGISPCHFWWSSPKGICLCRCHFWLSSRRDLQLLLLVLAV